ncbi:MAG TPA: type IV pilus twitching motility protein PilT [Armatimonadota bacterium]|nr:type IV pilus twitching motility protein PilT [Armatimonadota bacterium]
MLQVLAGRNGSDLHLTMGLPPMGRIDGALVPLAEERLDHLQTRALTYEALSDEQIAQYERTHELDCSYSVKNVGRFRLNVYRQRDAVGSAFRAIPNKVPTLEDLRLPACVAEVGRKAAGLVLVTGPTGSGKSTTLAAIVDLINTARACHVMTLEDPIEYLHLHKRSMINQREIGTDTSSFQNGLRAVLREDPDVVLVGEMRDLDTIQTAITLAETGHLVLASLHTRDASQAIDRIVDVFPSHQQQQIRIQLSSAVELILAQQLLPRAGSGRIVACEVMFANAAVRNLIREGKTHQLLTVIETSGNIGMVSMDKSLARLVRQGLISADNALTRCTDADNFSRLLKSV